MMKIVLNVIREGGGLWTNADSLMEAFIVGKLRDSQQMAEDGHYEVTVNLEAQYDYAPEHISVYVGIESITKLTLPDVEHLVDLPFQGLPKVDVNLPPVVPVLNQVVGSLTDGALPVEFVTFQCKVI